MKSKLLIPGHLRKGEMGEELESKPGLTGLLASLNVGRTGGAITMRNLGKIVAGITSLALLAAIGSLMPQPGNAANSMTPQPVLVTNGSSQPVPITGTVSGSVGASQAGSWNVGINNTPTVNVASMPSLTGAVNIANTPSVNIAGASGPLPVTATGTTQLLFDQSTTVFGDGLGSLGPVDVSSASRVRVECAPSVGNDLTTVFASLDNGFLVPVPISGSRYSGVIELPGSQLQLAFHNGVGQDVTFSCQVYGRP